MKRISLIPMVIIGLLALIVPLHKLGFNSIVANKQAEGPGLLVSEALAAEKGLKAGMIDPKTGKRTNTG